MGWINGLQRFTDIYVLGGPFGSPAHALYTIVSFIYERGFRQLRIRHCIGGLWCCSQLS